MRLPLYWYKCTSCGKSSEIPEMPEFTYGEFLLRNKTGETRYVNALEDPVFSEVGEIVASLPQYKNANDSQTAPSVQYAFGFSCDRDHSGQVFLIGQDPFCPACKRSWMTHFVLPVDHQTVEIEIPAVSHTYWNSLSLDDKKREIQYALEKMTE